MRGRASGDEASGRQSHRLVGTGDLLAQRCRMGGVAAAEVPHVPSTQVCRRRADKGATTSGSSRRPLISSRGHRWTTTRAAFL